MFCTPEKECAIPQEGDVERKRVTFGEGKGGEIGTSIVSLSTYRFFCGRPLTCPQQGVERQCLVWTDGSGWGTVEPQGRGTGPRDGPDEKG